MMHYPSDLRQNMTLHPQTCLSEMAILFPLLTTRPYVQMFCGVFNVFLIILCDLAWSR